MKTFLRVLTAAIVLTGTTVAYCGSQSSHPKAGFVPDAKTAIAVAEAVLIPIYGEKQIVAERPFTATVHGGVWTVRGTPVQSTQNGGAAEIEISEQSGCILRVTHGK